MSPSEPRRPITPADIRVIRPPRVWTARAYCCDLFFDGDTPEAAETAMRAHQRDAGHQRERTEPA